MSGALSFFALLVFFFLFSYALPVHFLEPPEPF